MQHSSWEVSMCIKAFRITNCFLSLNLKGHILLKGSSTPSIVPPKNISTKNTPISTETAGWRIQQHRRGPKKKHQSTRRAAVPLEDLRCRHPLPVILLLRCGGPKLVENDDVFSVWSLDLSEIKGCFDSHLDVSVEIFLLALKFKSQRNNIFQTILSIIVYVLPQSLPQVCYGPKGQAPMNCIDRRHLGRRFALPLPDVCLPVTGVADIRVKAVRRWA